VAAARTRARQDEGPTLIVATCYRFVGHFSGDTQRYRTREEVRPWLERDPISFHQRRLVDSGVITEDAAGELELEAKRAVAAALEFAIASPWPAAEEAWEDLYA
jgi:acetoin:2,6-dichlorophenolindophenol oxidoreductase subunit alpha